MFVFSFLLVLIPVCVVSFAVFSFVLWGLVLVSSCCLVVLVLSCFFFVVRCSSVSSSFSSFLYVYLCFYSCLVCF